MDISKGFTKRLKSNRLRQLKHYCQMCEKQCGDELGFRRHCKSAGHIKMMQIFAENPENVMSEFSKTFKRDFKALVSTQFCGKRILANTVYQEYIRDRHHVHMNATKWTTLSEFCEHLAAEGVVEVEDSDQGLYIKHVDRRPEHIAASSKKLKSRLAEAAFDEELAATQRDKDVKRRQILLSTEGSVYAPVSDKDKESQPIKSFTKEKPIKIELAISPSSATFKRKASTLTKTNVFKSKS